MIVSASRGCLGLSTVSSSFRSWFSIARDGGGGSLGAPCGGPSPHRVPLQSWPIADSVKRATRSEHSSESVGWRRQIASQPSCANMTYAPRAARPTTRKKSPCATVSSGLTATAPGANSDVPWICVNGHVEVVAPAYDHGGTAPAAAPSLAVGFTSADRST
jgi:hypothetical protein